MKKTVLAFVMVFITAFTAFAQTNKNENLPDNLIAPVAATVPYITSPPEKSPIMLHDLKIDIEVAGNFAMTTYDMVFHNPNQFILEGEFIMPLAENQNVSAVALDIEGKMRDGVVVEKQKDKQTFESIAGKDAGFAGAEKASVNLFKIKIYPFNPKSTRRIKITIEEPLITKDDNYSYTLPLLFDKQINFDLNVEIPSEITDGMPAVETSLPEFEFKKGNNVLKAGFSQRDYMLNGSLSLVLPRQKKEPVFTHKEGKETYFYSDIIIKPSSRNKVSPKTAAIVWDCSLSSAKRDIKRELSLLDAYFKKVSDIEIIFVTFNIKRSEIKNYSIGKGNWETLKKDISRIVYDGATHFDKLNLNDFASEEILLFTDGISTLGNTRLSAGGNAPLFIINSSAEFNRGSIAAAIKSGGSFINLNALTDKEAQELLLMQNLKLVSYSFEKGKIKALYPQSGTIINENFNFAGILTASESEITLSFGYDKNNIVSVKKIKVRAGGDNPSIERLWAVQKINNLELDSVKNEKEILKLGKKYSVVTEFTSLLILENAAEYALYKISPPKELQAEYDRIKSLFKEEEKYKKAAALEDAILQVQDIKNWWKKDYSQPKQVKALTAFGVRQEDLFDNVPAASEGEVNAPSFSQDKMYDYMGKNKNISFSGVSAIAAVPAKKEAVSERVLIKAWDPQVPYMKIIKNSLDEEIYADYLKLKAGYGDQPSFYFDIADEFIRRTMREEAVVVLSNIVEMKLDSPELLRIAAYKLMEAKSYGYAVDVFKKIIKLRAEDPQAYRDLALAYQANKEYKKALNTFYKILTGDWERFQSIKQIVFVEMNNLISLQPEINLTNIDKRLIFPMPLNIRIVLGWSTDDTDIDIYVKEPSGEEASYGNRFTNIGGRVSEDLTQGFGPEEYMIKRAADGEYSVYTDYFGDDRQSISGPTVLYLDIYTFYGTKNQTHESIMIRTENVKENNVIGTVNFNRK